MRYVAVCVRESLIDGPAVANSVGLTPLFMTALMTKATINEFIDKRVYFGGQFIQFILKGHSLLKINKLYLIHGGGPVLF